MLHKSNIYLAFLFSATLWLTLRFQFVMQAIKVLSLCCKASWNYAIHLSAMHVDKLNKPHDDLSEKIIADYVKEASDKSAFMLKLLNQEGSRRINHIAVESLRNWSVAKNLIVTLPTPASFVKEWVKVTFLSHSSH